MTPRVPKKASETSPLLPKNLEPSAGLTPDTPALSEEHNGDGGTIERQETSEERVALYEGIPELRKQMPYMFPALAIGVRLETPHDRVVFHAYMNKVFLAAADQTIIVSSYGRIGTELNALNKTSWIATACVTESLCNLWSY